MGGYGSGRWRLHAKKITVEDCFTLSTKPKVLREALAYGPGWSGSVYWTRGGEKTGSIGYITERFEGRAALRLSYSLKRGQEKEELDYRVLMEETPLHFGGRRWWFICALVTNGRACGRRVGKLHLPPGGRYFGCRACYDLTYTSCQESHHYDRLYALIAKKSGFAPHEIKRALR